MDARFQVFDVSTYGWGGSHVTHQPCIFDIAFVYLHHYRWMFHFPPRFSDLNLIRTEKSLVASVKGLVMQMDLCVCARNRAFSFWLKMFQCEAKSVLLTVKTTFNWVSGNKKKKTLPQISCFDFSTRRPGYNSAVRTQSEVFYVVENKYSKKKFSK